MTAPLRLRPVEQEDVDVVAGILAHPDLVGRRGLPDDRSARRSVAAIRKALETMVDPTHGEAWVVDAGGTVGVAFSDWSWDVLVPWAHVVIAPAHQRQGHGRAAASLLVDHLFEDTPAMVIQYGVGSWDATGLSFADGIGGERTGVRRRSGIRNGRYVDEASFALTRPEWERSHAARR